MSDDLAKIKTELCGQDASWKDLELYALAKAIEVVQANGSPDEVNMWRTIEAAAADQREKEK